MIPKNVRDILKKQGYRLVGKEGKEHSAVQVCRWTKKSLRDEGVCYKEQFYGIESHRCCQMTPSVVFCPNRCIHCWRAIEHTVDNKFPDFSINEISTPKEIISESIKAQKKLVEGFKGSSKTNLKKLKEAEEPNQFAISLSGEPTLYPKIGNLIEELKKQNKSSFLVTNGLFSKKLEEIYEKNQMPTQLYVSINAPNKELYKKIHRSKMKNAWNELQKTLEIFPKLRRKTRTVFRMNLVLNLNMSDKQIPEYVQLIKISKPQFIEIKGFMSVGFSRQRLGYERMPRKEEMKEFVKKLEKEIEKERLDYVLLDEHERSRAYVLGKKETGKKGLKIKI